MREIFCPADFCAVSATWYIESALFVVDIPLGAQQLGQQNPAAGGTAQGVVAQAHKFVVILAVRTEASGGDGHAALQIPLGVGLGPVGLLEVVDKLLGGGGEVQLLGPALKALPDLLDLLLGGLFTLLEGDEGGGGMAVGDGDAQTLGGDGGAVGLDNLDRKSTRLNSSHPLSSRMPSSA